MSVFRATSELHAIPNSCKKYIILQFLPLNHYRVLYSANDYQGFGAKVAGFKKQKLSFSCVSRCSQVWCRSRRFDCILPVFFRRWGRLVMRDLIKYDALLWLAVFFFSKRNVAIYITRDYIVRQTKNLAFIVIHHDEKPQLFLAGFSFKLVLKKFLLLSK